MEESSIINRPLLFENKSHILDSIEKKIKILGILMIIILLILIVLSIEYNIVINKFNGGLSGFGTFIDNSTNMVNSINRVISMVNETEMFLYVHKLKIIIDTVCNENMVNCNGL